MPTTVPAAPVGLFRQAARDTTYVLSLFPMTVLRFVVLVTLFAVGVATAPVLIGLPVLVLTLSVARRFADAERRRLGRSPAAAAPRHGAGVRGLVARLADPQGWRDLATGVFALVPATAGFALAVSWWVTGIASTLFYLWGWSVPDDDGGLPWLLRFLDLPDTYLMQTAVHIAVGILFLVTAPHVARAAAAMNARIVR